MASNADAVIFDLEASVPESEKQTARESIARYVRSLTGQRSPEVWVRVNVAGAQLTADLHTIDWTRVHGAVVAQAEDPETLSLLRAKGVKRLIPLIESVAGFDRIDAMGRVPNVERFAIGTWDLALDLRLVCDPDESELIWRLRGDLVLASCRAGLQSPIDGVHARLNDDTGLRAGCERARRLGFSAKLVIHPQQLPIVWSVFGPDEGALRHAREIIDAYEEAVRDGRGVTQLRGLMIDQPVVHRARALLARWALVMPALDAAP